jgi:type I restriction enzyme S subunit
LDEQHRIAVFLNSALAKLTIMQERREHATQVRNSLRESVLKAEQNTRPVRLSDLLTLERIVVDVEPELDYIQIGIRSFGNGIFHRDRMPGSELSKLRYFEVQPGRLIVSNIMAWEGAIAISTEADRGCVGSSRFLCFAPSCDVNIRYLNYYFQSKQGRELIRSTSTGTVLRNQTLSIRDFENLTIPLPSLDQQHKVTSLLDKSAELKSLSQEQDSTVSHLRLALLNAAFSEQL